MDDSLRNPLAAVSDSLAAASAAAARGVVRVRGGGRGASGIVRRDGLVTAEETLAQDEAIRVVLPDGTEVPAELGGRDPSTDVATLRVAGAQAPAWVPAGPPPLGALALAVGRGGEGPRVAFGIVATAGPAWTSMAGGRIDALIRLAVVLPPPLEGGAAIDAEGRLLGMAVADPRRRGLVIPVETIERAVGRIGERGYVARGYLGLALRPVATGLVVMEVAEGSPAATAGFLIGDVITTWNGETVRSMRDLSRRLGTESVGQSVKLGIIRGGAAEEREAVIGERRPQG